jgi:hypothetical protein
MAQRIVTICDAHARNDEETEGAPWEVTLLAPGESKATTWAIDLCEDDGKTLRDLAVMLDAVGHVTDGPRRRGSKAPTAAREAPRTAAQAVTAPTSTGAVACPVDGCDAVPRNRVALMSHLRARHDGMSLAEATGAPTPYACPNCDRRFSHPTGLGAHRRAAHGVRGAGSGAAG